MKRIVGFLVLAATPTLFVSVSKASGEPLSLQTTASQTQPQANNPASSHDRHHHRSTNSKRHHHHHKTTKQH